MTNPDWNQQIKPSRGRRDAGIADTGAHNRAIEIAPSCW